MSLDGARPVHAGQMAQCREYRFVPTGFELQGPVALRVIAGNPGSKIWGSQQQNPSRAGTVPADCTVRTAAFVGEERFV